MSKPDKLSQPPAAEWVDIDSLTAWDKNPRRNDDAAKEVAKSIQRFGFGAPVLARSADRVVIAGHTRLKAAALLGLDKVPCRFLDLDPAEARALALADNKLGELADWDDALLGDVLRDLEADGASLDGLGFTDDELKALLADPVVEPSESDDDAPEVDEHGEPDSVLGGVYELGPHRLVCGDSTTAEAWEAIGRGNLCLTDPPYGLGDTASEKNNYGEYSDTVEGLDALIADAMPMAQAYAPVVVLTPGNGNSRRWPDPKWTMAWFTPAGAGSGPWGFCCWQPILCYGKDPKLSAGLGRHPDAIVHTETAEKNGHPCPKPVKFWAWLVERTSERGQIVLDPFGGSGTTLIACAATGRVARLIELDPRYCDVIRRRWTRWAREHGRDPGPGALDG